MSIAFSLHSHGTLSGPRPTRALLPPVACHWSHVMPIAFPNHSIVFHLCIAFSWVHHISWRSQLVLGMSLLLCHLHWISKPCQCSPTVRHTAISIRLATPRIRRPTHLSCHTFVTHSSRHYFHQCRISVNPSAASPSMPDFRQCIISAISVNHNPQ